MKRIALFLIALGLLCAAPGKAESKKGFWKKLYRVSQFVVIGGHAVDYHSSLRMPEMNPLLRGADGSFAARRGVAIKAGAVVGLLLAQRLTNRHGRHDRLWAVTNLAVGGAALGVGIHNYGLPAPDVSITADPPQFGPPR